MVHLVVHKNWHKICYHQKVKDLINKLTAVSALRVVVTTTILARLQVTASVRAVKVVIVMVAMATRVA